MRIALVCWIDAGHESGVLKKMASQMRVWDKAGCPSKLFVLGRDAEIWEGARDVDHELMKWGGLTTRFTRVRDLVDRILAWRPDIVFFRQNTYFFPLARMMRQVPTVVEVNMDDRHEFPARLPWYFVLYHRLTRSGLLKHAAGFNCVTDELATRYAYLRKPTAIIPNGIDLSQFAPLPAPQNERPRLFFVGAASGSVWHGVDKILRIATALPECDFDIVGTQRSDLPAELPTNVQSHGYLGREKYQCVAASADVAIGTLAFHRQNIHQACTLKVREYLAFGIPTVIGCPDAHFPEEAPFLLVLPNREDNVHTHLTEIQQFIQRWRGRRVERNQIERLDMQVVEGQRLDFFAEIVEQRP